MPGYANKSISRIARSGRTFLKARASYFRKPSGVRPENVVWIFGSGRTGSSWLSRMMGGLEDHYRWNEPYVGELFGRFYEKHSQYRIDKHFVMAEGIKDVWLASIRNLILEEAGALFPDARRGGYVVIKEPHGAPGASLLTEALPESRVVLLIRDPRDVTASTLDAHRKKGWTSERLEKKGVTKTRNRAESAPDDFVKTRSRNYMQDIEHARKAYEAHEGPKTLVRYEDLRADPLNVMKRIYNEINVPVKDNRLARMVEKFSWKNVSKEEKGEGRIYRKAQPGGWREDLTPKQVKIVERITAPILDEFYPS